MNVTINPSSAWDEKRIEQYLQQTRNPLRLSVLSNGTPLIVPLWFEFDGTSFWCASGAATRLIRLITADSRCGIDVSDSEIPYRGVRGQGHAAIADADGKTVLARLADRYLADRHAQFSRWLLERPAAEAAIEIRLLWLTSWDFSARMAPDDQRGPR